MIRRTPAENNVLARRAAALRREDPSLSLAQLADALGLAGRTPERRANSVATLLHRARHQLGIEFARKGNGGGSGGAKQGSGSVARRETISVVYRELGVSGIARWLSVPEGRAFELLGGSLPTDDEQMAIDRAFAVARVRLLECGPGEFLRFDALARIERRMALGRMLKAGGEA